MVSSESGSNLFCRVIRAIAAHTMHTNFDIQKDNLPLYHIALNINLQTTLGCPETPSAVRGTFAMPNMRKRDKGNQAPGGVGLVFRFRCCKP